MSAKKIDEFNDLLKQIVDSKVDDRLYEAANDTPPKNKNFVQVYRKHMKDFRGIIRENPTAAELFYFLIEHMDQHNSLVCSSRVLEEILGKSKTTVWRASNYLKEKKLIDTSRMGNCTVYHINASVSWTSWSNQRKYAKFNAAVVLAESEQKELEENRNKSLELKSLTEGD